MIDREGAGAGFFRKSRNSEPAEEYPQQSGLSNKAMVYLVIMALIVILCIVYVFQLRSARRGGNSASFDVLNKYFTISGMPVASSTYWNQVHGFTADDVKKDLEGAGEPEAETSAEGAAETPAEASAEGEAEAQAVETAEAPAEGAEETPAE